MLTLPLPSGSSVRCFLLALLATAFVVACDDDPSKKGMADGGKDAGKDGDDVPGPADGGDDDASQDAEVPPPPSAHVFVLNDTAPEDVAEAGDPAAQVLNALDDAGHMVTNGGYYPSWDGVTPALTGVDVVIWLEGTDYGEDITEGMDTALQTFVNNGGILVRTEWGIYSVDETSTAEGIDALLPVDYADDYAYASAWNPVATNHPYLSDVTFPFNTLSGHSYVTAEEDAVVIAELTNNEDPPVTTPALTEKVFGSGKVIHLNHDVLYTVETLEPEILQILVNIATASVADDG